MAELTQKIETALNETRMLILGAEVLLGFEFTAVFQDRFSELDASLHRVKLGSLVLLLLTLVLLIAPTARHRLVEQGQASRAFHRFVSDWSKTSLLPLALGLSLNLYIAGSLIRPAWALGLALSGGSLALFFWHGFEALSGRHHHRPKSATAPPEPPNKEKPTPLSKRIEQVLIEARVVLPGAQAMIGFQFNVILMRSFEKLPMSMQLLHLSSLSMTAIAIVLLMTPAAYHRLVEQGEDSEHFHQLAGRFVVVAMVPLALGLCGDFWVVLFKITHSWIWGLTGAISLFLLVFICWFSWFFWRKALIDA